MVMVEGPSGKLILAGPGFVGLIKIVLTNDPFVNVTKYVGRLADTSVKAEVGLENGLTSESTGTLSTAAVRTGGGGGGGGGGGVV